MWKSCIHLLKNILLSSLLFARQRKGNNLCAILHSEFSCMGVLTVNKIFFKCPTVNLYSTSTCKWQWHFKTIANHSQVTCRKRIIWQCKRLSSYFYFTFQSFKLKFRNTLMIDFQVRTTMYTKHTVQWLVHVELPTLMFLLLNKSCKKWHKYFTDYYFRHLFIPCRPV